VPLIVMGVSGSGKSTVAAAVAAKADAVFLDADDFHPAANVAKMESGTPLTDADRVPWLTAVGDEVAARAARGEHVVMACSALRRSYRDLLRERAADLFFVHLDGTHELLAARIGARTDHFMPSTLLDSQLATLERLAPDEAGAVVDIAGTPDEIADAVIAAWPRRTSHTPVSRADVDPTLLPRLDRTPALNLENPVLRALVATASRLAPGRKVDGVAVRRVRDGAVDVRVYTPAESSGAALLWIHGGGLVLGAAKMDDRLCGETAAHLGATVVSVDYRLAPRHPFPAALDDAHAAWAWLLAHAGELGVDPARIAVGGQSAGGGLAANLVQRLHDEGATVAAQWLYCPMLDDRTAADRSFDDARHLVWNNRSNLVGWSSYLGEAMGDTVPAYSSASRREDLAGLPPAWIYTSDIELFHDEDVDYARRLAAAGVDVTLDLVRAAPHGFEAWATDTALAQDLFTRARAWLGERLRAGFG